MDSAHTLVKVTFFCKKQVKDGEVVYVCGGIPQLGDWNISRALKLKKSGSDDWNGEVLIKPTPEFEYKYFVSSSLGLKGDNIKWDEGLNLRMSASVSLQSNELKSSSEQGPLRKETPLEALQCSICFESFVKSDIEPYILPCYHTFCLKCIQLMNLSCAFCKKAFQIVQAQKNYTLVQLVSEIKSLRNNKNFEFYDPEKCEQHKREIDRFCKTCQKLMCSVCNCSHPKEIISNVNLQEKVLELLKPYEQIETHKKKLSNQIETLEKTLIEEVKKFCDEMKAKPVPVTDLRTFPRDSLKNCSEIYKIAIRETTSIFQFLASEYTMNPLILMEMKPSISFDQQILNAPQLRLSDLLRLLIKCDNEKKSPLVIVQDPKVAKRIRDNLYL